MPWRISWPQVGMTLFARPLKGKDTQSREQVKHNDTDFRHIILLTVQIWLPDKGFIAVCTILRAKQLLMVVLEQITWTLWVFGKYPTTQTVLTLDQSIQLDGKEKVNENAFLSAQRKSFLIFIYFCTNKNTYVPPEANTPALKYKRYVDITGAEEYSSAGIHKWGQVCPWETSLI